MVKLCSDGPKLVTGGVPLAEQIICVDTEGQRHGWKECKIYPVEGKCIISGNLYDILAQTKGLLRVDMEITD
jgi:hypothetical protein